MQSTIKWRLYPNDNQLAQQVVDNSAIINDGIDEKYQYYGATFPTWRSSILLIHMLSNRWSYIQSLPLWYLSILNQYTAL